MGEPAFDLARSRRIHLVGVGGAGISAIAVILAAMGHRVTGTDLNRTGAWPALEEAGVTAEVVAAERLFAAALDHGAELVAHSTAFPPAAADRSAADAAGITLLDRAGVLGLICAQRPTVAVSGTHGKTSTTAMLATLLDAAGADPSYLVGATPLALGRAARWAGEPGAFVAEADESDGTFLQMHADIAVVTNIDADHLDFWGDIDAIEAAFARFVAEARVGIVCLDDPHGRDVVDERARRVATAAGAVTVGEGPDVDLQVHGVVVDRLRTTFGLRRAGRELGPVTVGTPGRHHARNAAVAVAAALELGVPEADAVRAIAAYEGVTRRFEVVGEAFGATVVDDYAHNPGKVRALLASAREAGWPRVVAVFQPHRYTRTRDLLEDFGAALALADLVAVTEVYGAGEAPIEGITGRLLVEGVLDHRPWAQVAWTPTLDDAAAWVRATVRPGDLLLTVGAGDVSGLGRWLVAEAVAGQA